MPVWCGKVYNCKLQIIRIFFHIKLIISLVSTKYRHCLLLYVLRHTSLLWSFNFKSNQVLWFVFRTLSYIGTTYSLYCTICAINHHFRKRINILKLSDSVTLFAWQVPIRIVKFMVQKTITMTTQNIILCNNLFILVSKDHINMLRILKNAVIKIHQI